LSRRALLSCVSRCRDRPRLHSFPTRRSSDLPSSPATLKVSKRTRCLPGSWHNFTRKCRRRARSWSTAICPSGTCCSRRCAKRQRSEEHTSELQSRENLVCRLLLEKKKQIRTL